MKKTIYISAIILSMFATAIARPAQWYAPTNEPVFAALQTSSESGDSVTGKISDSHCRFKHMDGMESDEMCVHHCLGNGAKIVLVDAAKNQVYTLDEEGQKRARNFAARRVQVTGHVMGDMIHVQNIEAAE